MSLKAISHPPITSGGPTTAGDVAVWSNTSGTLLSDSGIASSNLALLNGTQTFTGVNTFNQLMYVNSIQFPSYGELFSVFGGGAWSFNLHGGTDVNLSIQDGNTVYGGLGSGVAFSSVNDAGTANEPMQFRSGGGLQLTDWAGGQLSTSGFTNFNLDTSGNLYLGGQVSVNKPYSGSTVSMGDSGIGHPGIQNSNGSLALQGGGGWGVDFYVDGGRLSR